MSKKILFLTLKVFSATGGIEKVCRVAGKALYETKNNDLRIFSIYDSQSSVDTRYFPDNIFTGFNGKKVKFIFHAIKEGQHNKLVVLSHINLLSVGYVIKLLSPKTKLVLFAHGIEVWNQLPVWKKRMLKKCDKILAVSNYTKEKIKSLYKIDEGCVVLNNCLDPFLPSPNINIDELLYERYKLSNEHFILITVTRIAEDEQYKGHEKVIEAIGKIIKEFNNIRYLIIGKYDLSEKERLDKIIKQYDLSKKIIFAGFVPDDELAEHYKLANAYIMPSKGEGFGIVFIEAVYYGLPVVAGNKDGSNDALLNGKLGLLIDPDNINEIAEAIKKVIINRSAFVPDHNLLFQKFSYDAYKNNLNQAVEAI